MLMIVKSAQHPNFFSQIDQNVRIISLNYTISFS